MRNRRRAAIWSVSEDWQRLYFFLFSIQFLVVAALVTWHKIIVKGVASWPDTLIEIGQTVSSLTIGIAGESFIVTEVVVVLSEWYRERRYNRGFADGIAQGIARNQKKWLEWNRRRLEAEAEGREFTEPPPEPESPVEKD